MIRWLIVVFLALVLITISFLVLVGLRDRWFGARTSVSA